MTYRYLRTARGIFVVTSTGIVIGKHYRRPPPAPRPTEAANDPDGSGIVRATLWGLVLWAVVAGVLILAASSTP